MHRVALVLAQKSQIERRARTPFEAFERVGELSPKLAMSARFPTVDSALKPTPQKNEKKYD